MSKELIARWEYAGDTLRNVLGRQGGYLLDKGSTTRISILVAFAYRAAKTNQAVRILSGFRLVEDVIALTRIMIETVITACYLQIASEAEVKAFQFFPVVAELKHHALFEDRFGPIDGVDQAMRAALDRARNKALAESKKSSKAQKWTEVSIAKQAELIDQHLGIELFVDTVTTAYVQGHSFIHPTPNSIAHIIAALHGEPEEDEITNEIVLMLHGCVLSLYCLAFFCEKNFGIPPDPGLSEVMKLLGSD